LGPDSGPAADPKRTFNCKVHGPPPMSRRARSLSRRFCST
jgi:hypothetical protein